MKYTLSLIALLFIFSCTPKKNQDAMIKELKKATDVLADKNLAQYHRIQKFYQSDSALPQVKEFYTHLSLIREYKENYKSSILKTDKSPDFAKETQTFIEKSYTQLDEEENKVINEEFKDSPLLNAEALSNLEQDETLPYVLALESEMITQEMYLVILKDFGRKKPGFDWEIYW